MPTQPLRGLAPLFAALAACASSVSDPPSPPPEADTAALVSHWQEVADEALAHGLEVCACEPEHCHLAPPTLAPCEAAALASNIEAAGRFLDCQRRLYQNARGCADACATPVEACLAPGLLEACWFHLAPPQLRALEACADNR